MKSPPLSRPWTRHREYDDKYLVRLKIPTKKTPSSLNFNTSPLFRKIIIKTVRRFLSTLFFSMFGTLSPPSGTLRSVYNHECLAPSVTGNDNGKCYGPSSN